MNTTDLNFVKNQEISVSEEKQGSKLKKYSFAILLLTIILSSAVFGFSYYSVKEFSKAKKQEEKFVNLLQLPENRKKEATHFLVKKRLSKMVDIEKGKARFYDNLLSLDALGHNLAVKNFTLVGKNASLTLEAADYQKIEDFFSHLDAYKINPVSLAVSSTDYSEGKYQLTVKFNFL